jgi:membrane-bound lytic murein transglycosylase D
MNRRRALLLFAAAPLGALAQTNPAASWDDWLHLGRQWAEENLDEDLLAQLGEVDEEQVRALLQQLQAALAQDNCLDLAALKDAAAAGLKLLQGDPATEPLAAWLAPRLDYFDVAAELNRATPAPRPPSPGLPAPPKPAPAPRVTQAAWDKAVKARPRPTAAAKFEAKLKPLFARERVPEALFWLAEIESGFDPKARSPAGAVGLYQLMPATAKELGLSTWPFDERKQPEKNAAAAARHLRALRGQFPDWPLALAAYNAGAGRVRARLAEVKTKTFAAIAARLPAETQLYVPKFDALLRLREGLSLARLPASA